MTTPPTLPLSATDLLTTTRAVRKRLDFDRPVERDVLVRCVELALQAPSGSNRHGPRVVNAPGPGVPAAPRAAYRDAYDGHRAADGYNSNPPDDHQPQPTARSAGPLAEHLPRAPALVLACGLG